MTGTATYVEEFDKEMGSNAASADPAEAPATAVPSTAKATAKVAKAKKMAEVAAEVWSRQREMSVQTIILSKDEADGLDDAAYYVKNFYLDDSCSPATRMWAGRRVPVHRGDEQFEADIVYIGAVVTPRLLQHGEFEFSHLSCVSIPEEPHFLPVMCFMPTDDPADAVFVALQPSFLEKLSMRPTLEAAEKCDNCIVLRMNGKPCTVPFIHEPLLKKKRAARARDIEKAGGAAPPSDPPVDNPSAKPAGKPAGKPAPAREGGEGGAAPLKDAKPASLHEPGDAVAKRQPTNLASVFVGKEAPSRRAVDVDDDDDDEEEDDDDAGGDVRIEIARSLYDAPRSEVNKAMGDRAEDLDQFVVDDDEEEDAESAPDDDDEGDEEAREIAAAKRRLRKLRRAKKIKEREAYEQRWGGFNSAGIAGAAAGRRLQNAASDMYGRLDPPGAPIDAPNILEDIAAARETPSGSIIMAQADRLGEGTAFATGIARDMAKCVAQNAAAASQKVPDAAPPSALPSPAPHTPKKTKRTTMGDDSDVDNELVREALCAKGTKPPSTPNKPPAEKAVSTPAKAAAGKAAAGKAAAGKAAGPAPKPTPKPVSVPDSEDEADDADDEGDEDEDEDESPAQPAKAATTTPGRGASPATALADARKKQQAIEKARAAAQKAAKDAAAAADALRAQLEALEARHQEAATAADRLLDECQKHADEAEALEKVIAAEEARVAAAKPAAAPPVAGAKRAAPADGAPAAKKRKRGGAAAASAVDWTSEDPAAFGLESREAMYAFIADAIERTVAHLRKTCQSAAAAVKTADRRVKAGGLLPPVTTTYDKYGMEEHKLLRPAGCYLVMTPDFMPQIAEGRNLGTSANILKRMHAFIADKRAKLEADWLEAGVRRRASLTLADKVKVLEALVFVCAFLVLKAKTLPGVPPSDDEAEDDEVVIEDEDDDIDDI